MQHRMVQPRCICICMCEYIYIHMSFIFMYVNTNLIILYIYIRIYLFEVDALLPDSCDPLNGHHPMIQVDSSNRW